MILRVKARTTLHTALPKCAAPADYRGAAGTFVPGYDDRARAGRGDAPAALRQYRTEVLVETTLGLLDLAIGVLQIIAVLHN